MHADAESKSMESTLPFVATPAGQRAKASVINAAVRMGRTGGAFRCTACRGRCEVHVTYNVKGEMTRTRGKCRTPGCIEWED
jgi:hypothetical protein